MLFRSCYRDLACSDLVHPECVTEQEPAGVYELEADRSRIASILAAMCATAQETLPGREVDGDGLSGFSTRVPGVPNDLGLGVGSHGFCSVQRDPAEPNVLRLMFGPEWTALPDSIAQRASVTIRARTEDPLRRIVME